MRQPSGQSLSNHAVRGGTENGKTARRLSLAAILLAALGLRLYGIDFGLPYLSNCYYRPDETLIVVPAVRFFESLGNPGFFLYPNLMVTLCAGMDQVLFFLRGLFGFAKGADLAADFGRDPSPYFLAARFLSAVAGTVAAALVYGIARKLVDRAGPALLAALLYATAPLAVRDAHFGVTDTLLACFTAGAVLAMLRYLEHGKAPGWPRAGAFATLLGLALATKYTALVLFPVAAVAVLVVCKGRGYQAVLRHGLFIALWVAVVFLLINPYVVIDFDTAWADLAGEYQHQTRAGPEAGAPGPANVFAPLRYGPGERIGLFFCLVGLLVPAGLAARKHRLFLASVAILFLLPLGVTSHPFFRYAVPALPVLSVLASLGIFSLLAGRPGVLRLSLAGLVMVLAVGPCLWHSMEMDLLLAKEDTRTLAGRWIADHVPPEVPVYLLCRPEQEPRLAETGASMTRRVQGMMEIYGGRMGDWLAEIHGLQRDALEEGGGTRFEVHRPPGLSKPKGRTFCVVTASYPGGLAGQKKTGITLGGMEPAARTLFQSAPPDVEGLDIDRFDAFYLPFNRLDQVSRPGPNLEVQIIDRGR